jgi:hypothetical protein
MVLCDGGILTTTFVSIVMNGVCCVWNEEMEVERREQWRQDIQTTYERQRMHDKHEMMNFWRAQLQQHEDPSARSPVEDRAALQSFERTRLRDAAASLGSGSGKGVCGQLTARASEKAASAICYTPRSTETTVAMTSRSCYSGSLLDMEDEDGCQSDIFQGIDEGEEGYFQNIPLDA